MMPIAYTPGPRPTARNMYPIWLTVDQASTRFRSSCAHPQMHPYSNVMAPTITTAVRAACVWLKIGADRTIRYTPAVTMVAAWISADTGVGPSIASSSQDCSGSCADLPHAPSRSSSPSASATPLPPDLAAPKTPVNVNVPNSANISMTASDRPASPTRFTTNAFFAATAADGLNCQNPISRYEARPTPSHPAYSAR